MRNPPIYLITLILVLFALPAFAVDDVEDLRRVDVRDGRLVAYDDRWEVDLLATAGRFDLAGEDLGDPTEYGLALAFRRWDNPISTVIQGHYVEPSPGSKLYDAQVGFRKKWRRRVQPYAGGGFGWTWLSQTSTVETTEKASAVLLRGRGIARVAPRTEPEDPRPPKTISEEVSESGSSLSAWVEVGLLVTLGDRVSLGGFYRYSPTIHGIELPSGAVDVESASYGLSLGLRF